MSAVLMEPLKRVLQSNRTENDGVPSGKSSKPLSRRDFKKFGNVEDRKPIADAWSQRVNEEGDSAADPHHVQAHDHDQAHTRFDLKRSRAWLYPEVPWGCDEVCPDGYIRGSSFLLFWQIAVYILTMYTVFRIPYFFAFGDRGLSDPGDCVALSDMSVGLSVAVILQDIMFGVDIIVQMHTAEYHVSEGDKSMQHLVDDLPTLYRNYFMGVIPWRKSFIWDLYSAIPWGRIGCAYFPPPVQGSSFWKALVFLGLNLARMFKIYRLHVVMNMVDKAVGVWTFIKLLLRLFITVHYISCAYFRAVADNFFVTEHDPEATWLDTSGLLPRTQNNWVYEYVTTLYWVVTTMSTVGYGDILPRTTFERAFTMCIMVGGVAFFAAITGTISEIISSSGRSALRFKDFMEEVEEFIKVTEVPQAQKKMMLQFFELRYPDQNIFNHDNIISQVPQGLRRQLLRETFGPLLNQVPLFCAISETSLLQLCGEMEIINCIPKERITIEGREPDSMYVVRHGHVQLFKGEQMLQKIGPGNMFGEIAIMGLTPDGRRWRSSQSVTQVELLQLKKDRFVPILLQNADIRKRFMTLASRQIERLRLSTEQGKQRIMWDPALNISISNWQLDYVTEMEEAEYSNKDVVWDLKQWRSFAESDPGKNGTELSYCEDAVIVHILCVAGLPTFGSEDSTVNFEIRGSWNSSGKVAPGGQDCTSVTLCPTKRADSVAVRATICVPVHHQPVEQEQEDKKKKKRKGDYVLLKFVYISTEGSAGPAASSGPVNEAGQAADENPSMRKCVHPVREEVVATFKIPIRDGFLDKCKSEDTPAKWLMKPKGVEKMVTWVSQECVLCDIEGAYRVQGRDGDDDVTGPLKVDVLVRRSAGFDVRRSLKAKIRSAVRTTKRKTKLKKFTSSICSGVCKVLYKGDPGKSAEAQCSVSNELESSAQMIKRAIFKLHLKLNTMDEKIEHNHAMYQKAFRDIVQNVEDLKKTTLMRFDAVDDKIMAQTATAKEDAGKIASLVSETSTLVSATSTKHDESLKTIQSAVYESADDLKKTVHETGQILEEAVVEEASKRTVLEAPQRSGALSLKSRFQGVTRKLIGEIKSNNQAPKSEPAASEPAIDIKDQATKTGLAALEPAGCTSNGEKEPTMSPQPSMTPRRLPPLSMNGLKSNNPAPKSEPAVSEPAMNIKQNIKDHTLKSELAVLEPAGHTSNGRKELTSSPQPSMTPRCLPPRPMASAARLAAPLPTLASAAVETKAAPSSKASTPLRPATPEEEEEGSPRLPEEEEDPDVEEGMMVYEKLEAIRTMMGAELGSEREIEGTREAGAEDGGGNSRERKGDGGTLIISGRGGGSVQNLKFVVEAMEKFSHNAQMQETSLGALRNMAADPEMRAAMRDRSLFELIIEALRQHAGHTGVVSVCCTLLRNLSAGDAENKRLLGDLGACSAVVRATRRHPNDEGIQRASASALWNLTAGNNDNKQASGQVAANTLAAAIRRHVRVAPVVEPVLGALASVLPALLLNTIGHAPAGAATDSDDVNVRDIIAVMRLHASNLLVQTRALAVLLCLCKNDATHRTAMKEAGGKELLMITLQEHSSNDRISDLTKRLLDKLELSAPASRSPLKRYQR